MKNSKTTQKPTDEENCKVKELRAQLQLAIQLRDSQLAEKAAECENQIDSLKKDHENALGILQEQLTAVENKCKDVETEKETNKVKIAATLARADKTIEDMEKKNEENLR